MTKPQRKTVGDSETTGTSIAYYCTLQPATVYRSAFQSPIAACGEQAANIAGASSAHIRRLIRRAENPGYDVNLYCVLSFSILQFPATRSIYFTSFIHLFGPMSRRGSLFVVRLLGEEKTRTRTA